MPSTYEAIATVTLTATAQTITFSSITSSYTDLVVIFRGSGQVDSDVRFRFNQSSASIYNYTTIFRDPNGTVGTNIIAGTSRGDFTYYGGITTTLGDSFHRMDIFNYADTNRTKTWITSANNGAFTAGWTQNTGLWESTAAITRIDIDLTFSGTNDRWMGTGTAATIYGIARA